MKIWKQGQFSPKLADQCQAEQDQVNFTAVFVIFMYIHAYIFIISNPCVGVLPCGLYF